MHTGPFTYSFLFCANSFQVSGFITPLLAQLASISQRCSGWTDASWEFLGMKHCWEISILSNPIDLQMKGNKGPTQLKPSYQVSAVC